MYQINPMKVEHERSVKTKEEFMIVYLNDAAGLFGNISNTAKSLLVLIWRDCEFSKAAGMYPGNTIELIKEHKEVWAKELKLSMGSLNNMLATLVENGILIKQVSPIYTLDPKRFFKGSAENRIHAIEVIYKYKITDGI